MCLLNFLELFECFVEFLPQGGADDKYRAVNVLKNIDSWGWDGWEDSWGWDGDSWGWDGSFE